MLEILAISISNYLVRLNQITGSLSDKSVRGRVSNHEGLLNGFQTMSDKRKTVDRWS